MISWSCARYLYFICSKFIQEFIINSLWFSVNNSGWLWTAISRIKIKCYCCILFTVMMTSFWKSCNYKQTRVCRIFMAVLSLLYRNQFLCAYFYLNWNVKFLHHQLSHTCSPVKLYHRLLLNNKYTPQERVWYSACTRSARS